MTFLSEEGPKSRNPSTFIRFIYNRVNLEKAVIRASAISALAQFGHKCPQLRKSIIILLQKCLTDSDDEVRERAYFYINLLTQKGDEEFMGNDSLFSDQEQHEAPDGALEKEEIREFVFDTTAMIDVDALEAYVL